MKICVEGFDERIKRYRYHTIKIKSWEKFIKYIDNYKKLEKEEEEKCNFIRE